MFYGCYVKYATAGTNPGVVVNSLTYVVKSSVRTEPLGSLLIVSGSQLKTRTHYVRSESGSLFRWDVQRRGRGREKEGKNGVARGGWGASSISVSYVGGGRMGDERSIIASHKTADWIDNRVWAVRERVGRVAGGLFLRTVGNRSTR